MRRRLVPRQVHSGTGKSRPKNSSAKNNGVVQLTYGAMVYGAVSC
jgi:hypothetical protein